MNGDFVNKSGYYDPVAAAVIRMENDEEANLVYKKKRNREVHETINEIKDLLESRDFELYKRIEIKDLKTLSVYK